jgi:hypothetical protein
MHSQHVVKERKLAIANGKLIVLTAIVGTGKRAPCAKSRISWRRTARCRHRSSAANARCALIRKRKNQSSIVS